MRFSIAFWGVVVLLIWLLLVFVWFLYVCLWDKIVTFKIDNYLLGIMSLYEKSWWKRTFKSSKSKKNVDILHDVDAMRDFLESVNGVSSKILKDLNAYEELEKERQVAKAGLVLMNLDAQADLVTKLIEKMSFLHDDCDLNMQRLEMITKQVLRNAKKAGMKDFVKENQEKWKIEEI